MLESLVIRLAARDKYHDLALKRFHTALMDLGSPPLGLIGTALERG